MFSSRRRDHRNAAVIGAPVVAALLLALPSTAGAQDPGAELAATQAEADAVRGEITAAEGRLAQVVREAAPERKAAKRAERAADAARARVDRLAKAVASERDAAAADITTRMRAYEEDKTAYEEDVSGSLGVAAIAALIALLGYLGWRFRGWALPRWARIGGAALLGLMLVGGLGSALGASAPDEPEVPGETRELAALASDNPRTNPPPALRAAIDEAKPLITKAARLADERKRAEQPADDIEAELAGLKRKLKPLADKEADLQKQVELAAQRAEEEAAFKAAAVSIDYHQLIKDPFEYRGDKVVYQGQIFQIQETLGRSIILLSVTDEGYGFWTDEIWVNADEIESAEEDVITVYGTVAGMKTYQTQIGGSRFVPKVNAKYIEE